MAAQLQNAHPNHLSGAKHGKFGPKFVTVCVSGDEKNGVGLTAFQVCLYVKYGISWW